MTPPATPSAQAGRGHSALQLQPFDFSRDIPSGLLEPDLPIDSQQGRVVAVRASPRGTAPGLGRPRRGGDRGELGLPGSARAACRPVFRRAPSAPGVQRRESRGHHRRRRIRRFPEANRSPRQRREVLGGNGGDSRSKHGQSAPPARVARAPCCPGRGGGHGRHLPGFRIARPSARHPFDRACLQGRAHGGAGKDGAEGCRRAAGSRAQRYRGHDGDREGREQPRQADLPGFAVGWIR